MLLWSLLFSCTRDRPLEGHLQICLPESHIPNMESDAPVVFGGDLIEFRDSDGDCYKEVVFMDGDTEVVIGYSQIAPEDTYPEQVITGYTPSWESADNVTVSIYAQQGFGTSYGVVVEDDDGILFALEEGQWGGALTDVDLPFTVKKSEEPIGEIKEECVTKTGYALTVGDEVMTPYAIYDLSVDQRSYKFLAIAAMEFGPGKSCETTDLSDHFSWSIFRP